MTRQQRRRRRQERRERRGPLRRIASALVTTLYIALAALLLVVALSPHLSWAAWRIDMLAQFSAHAAAATGAVVLWWLLWRRWAFVLAGIVALALHGAVLVPGRAAWATASEAADAGMGPVRVMQYNTAALNRDADAVVGLILQSDADLVSILEPSYQVLLAGFRQEQLKGAYPYFDQHERGVYLGWQYLLSKWPIREFEPGLPENPHDPAAVMSVVVERPGGAFGAVLIHPRSPRNAGRWRQGNELVERAVGVVNRMQAAGLPVVLLADLNATPSGLRNQMLVSRTELRRCKPLLEMEGTYASSAPWPRRIAIDDAWVSPEVRVTDWAVAGPAGSDHMAVIVDLLVPKGVPNAPVPDVDPYETLGLP